MVSQRDYDRAMRNLERVEKENETLREQVKDLILESDGMRMYINRIQDEKEAIEELRKSYESGLREISELREKLNDSIYEAMSLRKDYTSKFKKTLNYFDKVTKKI